MNNISNFSMTDHLAIVVKDVPKSVEYYSLFLKV